MYYTDCYLTCNSSGDFYLSDFLGTPGTSQYNSRRWRIATVDYFTERELNDNFSIATLRVDYNSSGAPSITKSPNTAIFRMLPTSLIPDMILHSLHTMK